MPRKGLTREKILGKAVIFINQQGYDQLTLVALAAILDVKPPALFKHYKNLDALKESLSLHGLQLLKQHLQDAVTAKAAETALKALCHAYHNFARDNKGLYQSIQPSFFRKNREIENAAMQLMEIIMRVLKSFNIAQEYYIHLLRVIRSSLHGFIVLEIEFGFGVPANIDESFEYQVRAIISVVNSLSSP